MALRLQHRCDEKCCRRTVFGVSLHHDREERGQPAEQTGFRLGSRHPSANYQRVRLLDDFTPQHPFTGEVMVNGGTREIGADGDRLERGGVVAKFAEDLTSRLYDALSRLGSLRCGRATGSST